MTNLAILGAGRIAHHMAQTVIRMSAAGYPVHLYGIASRDPERAAAFAAQYEIAHSWGSYEAMLADPAVDLVYVATPHSHHAAHMKLCIAAGKAVLCEKAFTANAAQAREVFDLADAAGVLVTEAIWTRYLPVRGMIDRLLSEGVIGEPKALQANLCYDIEDKPRITDPALAGGALLDVGVYALNFASMVFGNEITRMESSVVLMETGVDRTESIFLTYANGRTAQLMASTAFNSDRRGVIYGTDGYLAVDNVNCPRRIEVVRPRQETRIITAPEQITGYEYQVASCLKALNEHRTECPEMPHAVTIRIMEQMDRLRADWGVRYPFE